MAAFLYNLIRSRWAVPSLSSFSPEVVTNKTVLVTGASTGIGLEAARHYAQLGASRIILAVRSAEKGENARKNIEASLDQAALPRIDVWIVDLASFQSVQAFGRRINEELDTLDIAVLNAAVSKQQFAPTVDGWDESLQVNHLSTLLLGLLILPKLRESSRKIPNWTARLDFVASRAHQFVTNPPQWQGAPNILKALNEPDAMSGIQTRYGTSKLLLIYGVREIAKRVVDSESKIDTIVTYTCPGPTRSSLSREARESSSLAPKIILFVIDTFFCKTTEEGSRTVVYATGLGLESHGKWIHHDQLEEPGDLVTNKTGRALQQKVWSETLDVLQPYLPPN